MKIFSFIVFVFIRVKQKQSSMRFTISLFVTFLACLMVNYESAYADADLQEFVSGNNLFTAAVYKELLKTEKDNFVVSPLSCQTILALTQSGAKDNTAQEIRTGLSLPRSEHKIEEAFKEFLPLLKGNDEYNLSSANKVYVKNGFNIENSFEDVAKNVFQAGVENIDFSQKTEAANTINDWVESQTNNKIQNLIQPDSLNDDTRLILVNALYFSAKWENVFQKAYTSKDKFFKTAKDIVEVDTMHQISTFNYYECSDLNAKFLELPYEGGQVSMVIALPNDQEGLGSLESNIDKVFHSKKFTSERVSVSLPRFTIDTKIQLTDILKDLGVIKAFTGDADFSGIGGKKGELYISNVIQKAFINVTEEGTEAAAATAGIIMNKFGEDYDFDLNVDHPFMYFLRHKSGNVMFVGRLSLPTV